jgi:hypothetical protein
MQHRAGDDACMLRVLPPCHYRTVVFHLVSSFVPLIAVSLSGAQRRLACKAAPSRWQHSWTLDDGRAVIFSASFVVRV